MSIPSDRSNLRSTTTRAPSKMQTDIGLQDSGDHPNGLHVNGTHNDTGTWPQSDSYADNLDLDVLIVGAGFGGVYLLSRFRDEMGLSVKVFEAGKNLGGIWHWNCYPGARVDSMVPVYEYSNPKVWKDWTWTEKYPDYAELRTYFDHVDKVLDIKKDVAFQTRVTSAVYDKSNQKWKVRTEDGRNATCKYFIVATGFAAKRHFPNWKGLETFKGEIHHSSFWPQKGCDMNGKRVAVIGTGSTGVQLAQEVAPIAKQLTVFQRTPNLALPMKQGPLTKEEQEQNKKDYPELFKHRLTTFAGFPFDFRQVNTFDDTPEEREKYYQSLFAMGGFNFWIGTYKDMLYVDQANDEAYNFWAKTTRARIKDPRKRDILAPLEKPHPFGTKRPSLEQNYYEQFNRDTVDVVDVSKNDIVEFKPEGIVTADGKLHEFDIVALCTGFDSVTGGMKSMGLKDVNGVDLSEKWKPGTWTHLGMTCHGFPNMFFLYGAHGPTAFSNGPTCVEVQGDWIYDAVAKMRSQNISSMEPKRESEEKWHARVKALSDETLFPHAKSWYMGANIPGKPREQLNYAGGFPKYDKDIRDSLENWETDFTLVK